MKSMGMLAVVAVMIMAGCIASYGQNFEPEVPGDHFSLEGALELFKKSSSPEEFERMLNSPDSKVNNLDLNGDGYIDYIRVFDRFEGNVHAFILQAVVSDRENQDIAVIELEKLANGKAVLQIIGDEDIYGVETIIEPTREVRTYAGTTSTPVVVNVWAWPSVQYIYGPYYTTWYSPWRWHTYPVWWRSWRPVTYVHYHSIWRPYRPYYTYCHTRRIAYAHHIYRPYRTTSVIVHNRHHEQVTRYRSSPREDRSGRNRNDREYVHHNRPSSENSNWQGSQHLDRNRRTTQQGVVNSPNRSRFGDENTPDVRRNSTDLNRDDLRYKRPATTPNNSERSPQKSRPTENRNSTFDSPTQPQRSTGWKQNVPQVQRNSELKRDDLQNRRPASNFNPTERSPQQVTRPSENRSRTFENPVMQRSTVRERVPTENHQSTTEPKRDNFRNSRSGAFQNNNREMQQAPSRPAPVERQQSSGGSTMQQRPSKTMGAPSNEIRRGRH